VKHEILKTEIPILLWRWIVLFMFHIYTQQKSLVLCICKKVSNLCCPTFFASVCAYLFNFSQESEGQLIQHLYGVQLSANILAVNTSSTELWSIATGYIIVKWTKKCHISSFSRLRKQQKENEFAQKIQFTWNQWCTSPNLDMLLSALRTIQPKSTDS
jgi:hypothetical protein